MKRSEAKRSEAKGLQRCLVMSQEGEHEMEGLRGKLAALVWAVERT